MSAGPCVNILGDDRLIAPWRTGPRSRGIGETNGLSSATEREEQSVVSRRLGWGTLPAMEAFLIALASVAIAEIGDRTQLLSLALAAHYHKPWPIIGGVLVATIANHAVAGLLGAWFGKLLTPTVLDVTVGVSMVAMALWVLRPDSLSGKQAEVSNRGAFFATLVAFFIAEIGDKTQIATLALAAAYPNLVAVVAGTTTGMLIANVPAIFLGDALADKLPIRQMNYVAAVIFGVLGVVFIIRALT
jgi:putative Ca2+/H+ antiporter (TMEM165/GDT1 family)